MMNRFVVTILCAVVFYGHAAAQMRPEQMVAHPWNWTAVQAQPPCAPSTTTGTITLTLNACANPVTPSVGGSPDYWQFTLTGNGTLAVAANTMTVGQIFRLEVSAGSNILSLPSPPFIFGSGVNTTFTGNSSLVCSVHDTTPTFWCPGGVIANIGSNKARVPGGSISAGISGASNTNQIGGLSVPVGQTLACYAIGNGSGNAFVSATVTYSDSTTGAMTNDDINAVYSTGTTRASTFHFLNVPKIVTNVTATYTGSPTLTQIWCDTLVGVSSFLGHNINPQANVAVSTPFSSLSATSASGALVWGASSAAASGVVTGAGSGFALGLQDTSGAWWAAATVWKISTGSTDVSTFSNTAGPTGSVAPAVIIFQ